MLVRRATAVLGLPRAPWLLVWLCLSAGVGSTPAGAFLPAPYGGRVTVPLAEAPVTLDPARITRESELQLCSLLYDTLFVSRSRTEQVPHLARPAPEVSADGMTWKVRLRPGVLLHDGRTLTAADVVKALRRLHGGRNGWLLATVKSIEPGTARDTVVLRLHRPTPELALLLSAPAAAITVASGPAGSQLVGSGPFRLHARSAAALQLRAYGEHFAGRPLLDELVFRVFDRSSAEVAAYQVGALQLSRHGASVFGAPKFPSETVDTEPLTTVFLGFGSRLAYLVEPTFRSALSAAIDRQRLQRLAGTAGARVAHGPVSPRLLRHQPRPPQRHGFDRKLAGRLLARAARQHEALRQAAATGLVRLELLVDASRPDDRIIAGQLVADLDRIGIAARIETRPAADYQARLEGGRFELALGRLALQVPAGGATLAAALAAAGDRAGARQCISRRGCGAVEVRRFIKTLPFVPLVHPAMRLHYDSRLGGLRPTPAGWIPFDQVYWRRKR